MKKFLLIALSSVLALGMLTACGETNQTEPENEPVTPPDLVGEWKQTNSNAEDAWQAATIAGSFEAPTTADEPYTWESENDKDQTDMAILASGDDTKTFTYQDGVISYEVSAMGVTQTVKLEKQ